MGWQWHQLDHMQIICILLQTDNHASTSPLTFYRPDVLPAAQPTESKHWRQYPSNVRILSCNIKMTPTELGQWIMWSFSVMQSLHIWEKKFLVPKEFVIIWMLFTLKLLLHKRWFHKLRRSWQSPYWLHYYTVSSEHLSFLSLVFFITPVFLVPWGRLSWLPVSFWAHKNIVYDIKDDLRLRRPADAVNQWVRYITWFLDWWLASGRFYHPQCTSSSTTHPLITATQCCFLQNCQINQIIKY